MVSEIHEVFVMSPEIAHIKARCAAGKRQCVIDAAEILLSIRAVAEEICHLPRTLVGKQAGRSLAALLLRKAQIVPLKQVDV